MAKRFEDGDSVRAVYWDNGDILEVGKHGLESLTVVMEDGQMGRAPWVEAVHDDGRQFKHNLAKVESVRIT
jgi:hypothetical protein